MDDHHVRKKNKFEDKSSTHQCPKSKKGICIQIKSLQGKKKVKCKNKQRKRKKDRKDNKTNILL